MARSMGWVCATDGARLIGFVNVAWDGGAHAFLLNTSVHRNYQRRGIGTALVREAIALARDGGAEWLALWQWAREHREILALTRRDRWVDTAADVRIHVVTPSETKTRPITIPGLATYRLTLLRLGEKTVATVVPS